MRVRISSSVLASSSFHSWRSLSCSAALRPPNSPSMTESVGEVASSPDSDGYETPGEASVAGDVDMMASVAAVVANGMKTGRRATGADCN